MNAIKVISVRSGMSKATNQLYASIGSEACVKKVTSVSSCMSMTCQRCPSATFIQNTVSAAIKSVSSCIWIRNRKSSTAHGMTEAFVDTVTEKLR